LKRRGRISLNNNNLLGGGESSRTSAQGWQRDLLRTGLENGEIAVIKLGAREGEEKRKECEVFSCQGSIRNIPFLSGKKGEPPIGETGASGLRRRKKKGELHSFTRKEKKKPSPREGSFIHLVELVEKQKGRKSDAKEGKPWAGKCWTGWRRRKGKS